VAPELVQDDLTPERLSAALAPLLDDPRRRTESAGRLSVVRDRLGGPGASERAASLLCGMLS
jgi:lipid-A-disaccharide synthase